MKTNFDLLKNGKVAQTVWANKTTKEIFPANRNSFGYNMNANLVEFSKAYGHLDLKKHQGKGDYSMFYHSAKQMESLGFQLVKRGENPLW